jgi:hypothetical protein
MNNMLKAREKLLSIAAVECVLTDQTRFIYHVKFSYGWRAISPSNITK